MSYAPPNAVPYRSANQTDARPSGPPCRRYPLPEGCPIQLAGYAFDQEYEMKLSSFPPVALNYSSNGSSVGAVGSVNAILASYGKPAVTMAGLGKFAASFNAIPATWNDFTKTLPFTFPGFLNTINGQPRRDPFTDTVQLRIQMDYFVLDPLNIISSCTAGTPAASSTVNDTGGTAVNCVFQLSDIALTAKSIFGTYVSGTPDFTQRTNSLVPSGGIISSGTTYLQTNPTPAHYKSWIAAAIAHGWSSLVWDGSTDGAGTGNGFGQLVAETSRLEPYAGNIIARLTQYILAI